MKLVSITHPVLLAKAKPVKKIDSLVLRIISDMKTVLQKSNIGIGLAAPQVGIPLQIFLVSPNMPEVKNKKSEPISVYVNPKITKMSKPKRSSKKKTLEGCLSIPDVWGRVARSTHVTLEYTDEKGKRKVKEFQGYTATIIQHEVDHLHGILFTRRAIEQEEQLFRSVKDELKPIDV